MRQVIQCLSADRGQIADASRRCEQLEQLKPKSACEIGWRHGQRPPHERFGGRNRTYSSGSLASPAQRLDRSPRLPALNPQFTQPLGDGAGARRRSLQRLGRTATQPSPGAMIQLRQHQPTNQSVPEGQAPIRQHKQSTHPRRGHRISHDRRHKAADLAEHLRVHLVSEDGCRFHHAAGGSVKASQPAGNDLGVAHRPRVSRHADKVLHQERQPSGIPVQARQDRLRSGVHAEARSGHRGDLPVGQRREMQVHGVAGQRCNEPGRPRLIRARGEHDCHRERGDMVGQVLQHRHRFTVRPVHVLQHHNSAVPGR